MSYRRDERNAPAIASQPRTIYLTAYNIFFASLWASVFVRAISNAQDGKFELFNATESYARWIQTASLVEVLHAAFGSFIIPSFFCILLRTMTGIIKSPVSTTALQVVTRVIQVWMVWYSFPQSTATSDAYLALLLAWSVADTIRYLYLALNMHGKASKGLVWLRYTMFYPLYPIGIGAEWWLIYQAIAPGAKVSPVIPPVFYFCLMLYIPGSYTMYTYMIKQRRKTLKTAQKLQ